jgi:hypothetical protein
MPEIDTADTSQEESIKNEVASELEEAKKFTKSLSIEDVKSGQWFISYKICHSKSSPRPAQNSLLASLIYSGEKSTPFRRPSGK